MIYGILSIGIVIFVIIGAMKTRRCDPFLIMGTAAGVLAYYKRDFFTEWISLMEGAISEQANLILICLLIGAIIRLLNVSGGGQDFADNISKHIKTERHGLVATTLLTMLIFLDDYMNVLSVGTSMKPVYKRLGIRKESMGFILLAASVSFCMIFPLSAWAAYFAAIFYSDGNVKALGFGSGLNTYLHALPYALYPIVMMGIVFLFSFGILPKTKGMKQAEGSENFRDDSEASRHNGKMQHFLIPLLALVIPAAITQDLLVGEIVSIVTMVLLYTGTKLFSFLEIWKHAVEGFHDMMGIIIILVLAKAFQRILRTLGIIELLAEVLAKGDVGTWFPLITFVLSCLFMFMLASSWGTCSLCGPIFLEVGAALGANLLLVMGAIMSGCVMGNHLCFYCDTAILTAQTTDMDTMSLLKNQMPYTLAAFGISAAAYGIMGVML